MTTIKLSLGPVHYIRVACRVRFVAFEILANFPSIVCSYFTRALEEGWLKGQPQEVVAGGLNGIQGALERLKDGTASAVKYVFKISDTEGAGSGS